MTLDQLRPHPQAAKSEGGPQDRRCPAEQFADIKRAGKGRYVMPKSGWQDNLDYDPHCRRCDVPLMIENARMSRGRFVGACRMCESQEVHDRKGFKTYYVVGGKGCRKYPVPNA